MMRQSIVPGPLWSLAAGFLAALGASVCCVLPLVMVSLGLGGAWLAHLTALEPWRPWFIAATAIALGMAGWRLYGPNAGCDDDRVCANVGVQRRQRVVLWLVVAVVVPLLAFPYVAAWIL
jgi:mercuric ion transport protein